MRSAAAADEYVSTRTGSRTSRDAGLRHDLRDPARDREPVARGERAAPSRRRPRGSRRSTRPRSARRPRAPRPGPCRTAPPSSCARGSRAPCTRPSRRRRACRRRPRRRGSRPRRPRRARRRSGAASRPRARIRARAAARPGAPGTMPVRSAATARITSWWPFSHTSLPGRQHEARLDRRARGRGREVLAVDARVGDDDPLGRDALEQQAGAGALAGCDEEVGRGEACAPARRARAASGRSRGTESSPTPSARAGSRVAP